jgi:hypothetical protein
MVGSLIRFLLVFGARFKSWARLLGLFKTSST